VALVTVLIGPLFGIIAPAVSGHQAAKQGLKQTPYWITWLVTSIVWIGLLAVIASTSGGTTSTPLPLPLPPPTAITHTQVEKGLLSMDWSSGAKTESSVCAYTDTRADGTGRYNCYVTFSDGHVKVANVTVDADGTLVAQ
jgi:4-amino-4-deoxy-L-arabinose transferase-like glycosyltransferase